MKIAKYLLCAVLLTLAVMRRIYPTRKDSLGVTLYSEGGPSKVTKLEAWDMMPSNPW